MSQPTRFWSDTQRQTDALHIEGPHPTYLFSRGEHLTKQGKLDWSEPDVEREIEKDHAGNQEDVAAQNVVNDGRAKNYQLKQNNFNISKCHH